VGIVDLVPSPSHDRHGAQVYILEEGEDLEHLLVIDVVAEGREIRVEEGQVVLPRELPRELVDVHGLVVGPDVLPAEVILVHDAHDPPVIVEEGHRPVHPALELRYDRDVRSRRLDEFLEQFRLENQVAFEKEYVVAGHSLPCQP